jgi:hypothetical protein
MPKPTLTDEQRAHRQRVMDGARIADLAEVVASRYHSTDPVHRAAVDCEALRTNVHQLAAHRPQLKPVLAALDVAATQLSDYAEAVGL